MGFQLQAPEKNSYEWLWDPPGAFNRRHRVDLRKMFLRVQEEMRSCLASGVLLNHISSTGAAFERGWIDLLNRYLPERYRASSAFVVDSEGRRSRQTDVVIYDRFYSPLLFPHNAGPHIPAESVYAVFEVKGQLDPAMVLDAGMKAASVRRLTRTSVGFRSAGGLLKPVQPQPILAGILARHSVWSNDLKKHLARSLAKLGPGGELDFGCAVDDVAFEVTEPAGPARKKGGLGDRLRLSRKEETLIFFVIRLLDRLRGLGTAPALDYGAYYRPGR
jgi:hypothetical protein